MTIEQRLTRMERLLGLIPSEQMLSTGLTGIEFGQIIAAFARSFKVLPHHLQHKKYRTARASDARHAVVHYLVEHRRMFASEICPRMAFTNPTSVHYAHKKVVWLLVNDKHFAEKYEQAINHLK